VTWRTNGDALTWTLGGNDGGYGDGDGGYGRGDGGGYGDGYGYGDGDGGDGDGGGGGSTESLSFPLVDEMVDVNLRACAAVARQRRRR